MYAYAYSRCSHRDSAESGAGLAAQDARADELFRDARDLNPDIAWSPYAYGHDRPGHFCDRAVSAWSVAFFQRPAGRELWSRLKPGDHLFVARTDRLFRSVADMGVTLRECSKRDIRVTFGDIPMSTDTAIGQMMLGIMVTLAQWESKVKSDRIREANAIRRAVSPGAAAKLSSPCDAEKHTYSKRATSAASDPRILDTIIRKQAKASQQFDKPGKIYLYIRCSHLDSAESGLGLKWQLATCQRQAKKLMDLYPGLEIGGIYTDEAISAWKHRLKLRPEGKKLHEVLQDGDHVVFARLDRAFRSLRDMSETLPDWQERGAVVHFCVDGLDMSTAMGRATVAIMAVFAELESTLTSSRTKEALRELRQQGRGINRLLGFKKEKVRGFDNHKRVVPDRRMIAELRLMYVYRLMGKGGGWICRRLEELRAKREGRRPLPPGGVSVARAREWFGGADFTPYLANPRPGYHRLVQPHWRKWSFTIAIQRYPLIRDYLIQKRNEARETRLEREALRVADSAVV